MHGISHVKIVFLYSTNKFWGSNFKQAANSANHILRNCMFRQSTSDNRDGQLDEVRER